MQRKYPVSSSTKTTGATQTETHSSSVLACRPSNKAREKCGGVTLLVTGSSDHLFPHVLVASGQQAAACSSCTAALTSLHQVHLNAAPGVLAAVRAQVRSLQMVQADGEVPPRSSVGEDLHSTLPGRHERHAAPRREVDQEGLLNLHP